MLENKTWSVNDDVDFNVHMVQIKPTYVEDMQIWDMWGDQTQTITGWSLEPSTVPDIDSYTLKYTIEDPSGAEVPDWITLDDQLQITLHDIDTLVEGDYTFRVKGSVYDQNGQAVDGAYNEATFNVTVSGATSHGLVIPIVSAFLVLIVIVVIILCCCCCGAAAAVDSDDEEREDVYKRSKTDDSNSKSS